MATISALCVSRNSAYHGLPGVVAFDIDRDARTFLGDTPIVAHPPCRAWSAFCSHQAKAPPGEKELAPMCVELLRQCGGVLEHPAHSRLWPAMGLPRPGERPGGGRFLGARGATSVVGIRDEKGHVAIVFWRRLQRSTFAISATRSAGRWAKIQPNVTSATGGNDSSVRAVAC